MTGILERVDLNALIRDLLPLLRRCVKFHETLIVKLDPSNPHVLADRGELEIRLIKEVTHVGGGGETTIQTHDGGSRAAILINGVSEICLKTGKDDVDG